jgi:hypothetical protein
MARYEHLPLYKTAMELTVYIETVVRSFSRYHKYTLGTDLRQQSRALVTVIIRKGVKSFVESQVFLNNPLIFPRLGRG